MSDDQAIYCFSCQSNAARRTDTDSFSTFAKGTGEKHREHSDDILCSDIYLKNIRIKIIIVNV